MSNGRVPRPLRVRVSTAVVDKSQPKQPRKNIPNLKACLDAKCCHTHSSIPRTWDSRVSWVQRWQVLLDMSPSHPLACGYNVCGAAFLIEGGSLKCVRIIPWYTIIITSRLVNLHPSSFGYRWVTANKATGFFFFLVFSFFGALHRKCDPKGSNTSGTGASSRRRIIECIVWTTSLVACFCFFPFCNWKILNIKEIQIALSSGLC